MMAPDPANGKRRRKLCASRRQEGLTLVELMISITLGLFVVLAATSLLLSAQAGYATQDESIRIQENGRYAIDIIANSVRQAAFENWDAAEAPVVAPGSAGANIAGLDDRSLKRNTAGIESPVAPSINGSDVLAVRFFGAGTGDHGDGTIVNCAGAGVPAARSQASADEDRGWSIFYVAKDASGEPELYCKYRGVIEDDPDATPQWSADAIARGVESFQVLYGLDTDGDGLPNRFLAATAINVLDNALVLAGATPNARAIDKNRKTHWKKVVAIKVALLVRGNQSGRPDASVAEYDLFGKDYAETHANTDPGTRVKEADLPQASRTKGRKIFTSTIELRNHAAGGPT